MAEHPAPDPEWRRELAALTAVSDALEPLEAHVRERVVRWAVDRFLSDWRLSMKAPDPRG